MNEKYYRCGEAGLVALEQRALLARERRDKRPQLHGLEQHRTGKGNGLEQLHGEFSVLGIFILVFGTLAMLRYKNTLD